MKTVPTKTNTSRRAFLRSGVLTAASIPIILPSRLFGQDAPSKKITLGFIGMGQHGVGRNLSSFLNEPDIKVLAVCDGKWSASDPAILRVKEFGPEANYWPRPEIEHRDFLDAMKSRSKPAYHVEAGHRLATTLHLGHLAITERRAIQWDPAKESFANDDTQSAKSIIYKRESRDWENA